MVGLANAAAKETRNLQILFDLVIATRIHRQCNPKAIEVAFLSVPAIEFFAQDQLQALQEWYLALGQGLQPVDATVKDDRGPLPSTFLLHDVWMFGCTKPTSEVTAVAQTLLCRTSWASES